MPLRYTGRILDHLAHAHYKPSTPQEIARQMRVGSEDQLTFEAAIDHLAQEKKLRIGKDGRVRLPSFGSEIVGRFRLNERGFGFVIPEQPYAEGHLFVPPGQTGGAVSRDIVRAQVIRAPSRGRGTGGGAGSGKRSGYTGRIIEVLQRGRDNFVGTLVRDRGKWLVIPDGMALHEPVLVRDPHAKNAKQGDKVVIELLHYPDHHYVAEGVITQVLGEAGRPDVETQAVITAHGLRTEFPEEALDQAREVTHIFNQQEAAGPWNDRENLTDKFIFTIDPPDARDFDDAISIDYDPDLKEYTLGVHIADVAHFIDHASPLDQEAKLRGNSVYLPRMVIPMLPELLSNGVCSLQEGVARFAKSVFIKLDNRGRVVAQRVAASVIASRKRLTYLEAQALIDGDLEEARAHARTETEYTKELIENLKLCERLSRILEKRRHRQGSIALKLPEVQLIFDEDGHVIDAEPEDDAYTHKIIEMFMVEANEAIARTFEVLGIPILRRIHPEPRHGDLTELQMYARAAHQHLPDDPTRFDLQRLLDATWDTPAVRAIHFAVLRTLAKASYSPAMIGHYALASDHYAHFTSPIRRYPDLTLHRALTAYLEYTNNGRNVPKGKDRKAFARRLAEDPRVLDEAQLIELGRHCSDTELEATAAERELRDFLVMQFLHEHHLGDEFPGVVTGVLSKGLFVSIERFLVEGLVTMSNMPSSDGRPDRWLINEATGRMVARRSGASLSVGDIVTVQIVSVDLASRHLELMVTKLPEKSVGEEPDSDQQSKDKRARRPKGKTPRSTSKSRPHQPRNRRAPGRRR